MVKREFGKQEQQQNTRKKKNACAYEKSFWLLRKWKETKIKVNKKNNSGYSIHHHYRVLRRKNASEMKE